MTAVRGPHNDDEAPETLRTITLSDREIDAAARLLNLIVGVEVDRGRELNTLARSNPETVQHDRSVLIEEARRSYVNRARRSSIFSPMMFGEAAWDMLLALYVTDQGGARHTVSGLLDLSGVPSTTALRWLKYLESELLVCRSPNPFDGRVFRVELTDKARGLLDSYFSGIVTQDS